ncbi:ABC transporter ATP-binding protein [Nakamurella alba]|nr:ABC transporter ATP-binding protein [Nakamurella alba]
MTTTTGTALEASGLRLGYPGAGIVVPDLDLSVAAGTVTTIVGPNGCGKSTVLRALARLLKPSAGTVRLFGEDLHRMNGKAVARRLAVLPQSPLAPAGITVRELVLRGRNPHQNILRQWSAADADITADCLRITGLEGLGHRVVQELSGGQRQRAWLAMVLAQQAEVLVLDEPTTFLDLTYQLEVLHLVRTLNREQGRTVLMVLHDLNLAARYSDRLVLMSDGAVVADGAPAEVLTPELLRSTFRLEATVIADPATGGPLVVPKDLG